MADEPSRGSGQFILNSLFAIRYSPFAIRHSLFAIRHSPFAIRHSPFAIRYSLFAIPASVPHPSLRDEWGTRCAMNGAPG